MISKLLLWHCSGWSCWQCLNGSVSSWLAWCCTWFYDCSSYWIVSDPGEFDRSNQLVDLSGLYKQAADLPAPSAITFEFRRIWAWTEMASRCSCSDRCFFLTNCPGNLLLFAGGPRAPAWLCGKSLAILAALWQYLAANYSNWYLDRQCLCWLIDFYSFVSGSFSSFLASSFLSWSRALSKHYSAAALST